MRRNIYEIIKNGNIDLKKEYSRIYSIFFDANYEISFGSKASLEDIVDCYFDMLFPGFVGRCLSLDDFNESYNYSFEPMPDDFSIDTIIKLSEYVANFVNALMMINIREIDSLELYKIKNHIDSCMEDIVYTSAEKEGIIIYTECSPAAVSVAEISDDKLAYSVLRYNHHALKGNLYEKKIILKFMADDIENDRKKLNEINNGFSVKLFRLFNTFLRHNNDDNNYIKSLSQEDLESIYDDIYQMWLLAKLQLEYYSYKNRIDDVIKEL